VCADLCGRGVDRRSADAGAHAGDGPGAREGRHVRGGAGRRLLWRRPDLRRGWTTCDVCRCGDRGRRGGGRRHGRDCGAGSPSGARRPYTGSPRAQPRRGRRRWRRGKGTLTRVYDPSIWRDYFVMVGGGAAALTGLVFVAMTLHLENIVHHPVHRHRARTILTGLTAVFIRCGLVLMGGQSRQAVGVEIFVVLVVVEVILYRSVVDAFVAADRSVLLRAVGSFACLVLEQLGAVALFLGAAWGLYVVGLGMMSSFVFMVTGAWLLLVGVEAAKPAAARAD